MDKMEKERKFILKRLPSLPYHRILNINQFYIDGMRYRMEQDVDKDFIVPTYWKMRKSKVSVGVNMETGLEQIQYKEFYDSKWSGLKQSEITKERHIFLHDEKKFEIDVFKDGITLIMLEIEDVEIGDSINFPPEIEECLLMEVTGNEAFDNFNLAK